MITYDITVFNHKVFSIFAILILITMQLGKAKTNPEYPLS